MGCIEILSDVVHRVIALSSNRNMGCIEIVVQLFNRSFSHMSNRNMGCIEIRKCRADGRTDTRLTETWDVLKL